MPTYEVHIKDITLIDEVFDVQVTENKLPHSIEHDGYVTLRLDKTDPSRINLYWPVIVDEIDGTRKRLLYGVVVRTSFIPPNKVVLECEGPEKYLRV